MEAKEKMAPKMLYPSETCKTFSEPKSGKEKYFGTLAIQIQSKFLSWSRLLFEPKLNFYFSTIDLSALIITIYAVLARFIISKEECPGKQQFIACGESFYLVASRGGARGGRGL